MDFDKLALEITNILEAVCSKYDEKGATALEREQVRGMILLADQLGVFDNTEYRMWNTRVDRFVYPHQIKPEGKKKK